MDAIFQDGCDRQEQLRLFVQREVYYCVSALIHELAQKEEYLEELWEICQQDNYQSAAEEEGYIVAESSGGEYYYRTTDDIAFAQEMCSDNHIEVFHFNGKPVAEGDCWHDADGNVLPAGWYYWTCSPSCLPESEPMGPYDSEDEAKLAACKDDELEPYTTYDTEEAAWQAACNDNRIEPHTEEAYEHWIVSDWLADRLAEKGEMVTKDFLGLTIWGRCGTGQAIFLDAVIEAIYVDRHRGPRSYEETAAEEEQS
jgi:hypothetical protein